MDEGPGPEPAHHRVELLKEAFTMALYVAICLLAALIALPESAVEHTDLAGLVWGVTVGLALAHLFAFRLSARLVGAGAVRREDVESGGVQLLGAAAIALPASVVVLLLPTSAELEVVELLLAGFIALTGFAVARGSGAGLLRSLVYAAAMLVVAVLIAVLKNVLAGH